MSLFSETVRLDPEVLQAYDMAGPRYTSYPTAPQFNEAFSEQTLLQAIDQSNQTGRNLSLYFHIPFCESLCYYCGCNKIVTPHKSRARPYLERMIQEAALYAQLIHPDRKVTQIHWGGGTPTFLSHKDMAFLMESTRRLFNVADPSECEIGIEIHPGQVDLKTLHYLRGLGFNRISMGIQDFDPQVQKAVNRFNTFDEVKALVDGVRKQDYQSLSMDLIYGLPLQTIETFHATLAQVIKLSPDRLSIFNYAHMPHLFKSQRLINEQDLPTAASKIAMLSLAIDELQAAGYRYIGMDHFAKPSDSLSKAQDAGLMQRNFQGYSTHADTDLFAFGVSSISQINSTFVQNAKDLNRYQQLLDLGQLPVIKGIRRNQEDELRAFVINQLICHFSVDFTELENQFGINAAEHFKYELAELMPMKLDGLISLNHKGIHVHNAGRLLIRRICMVFDEYLRNNKTIRYSKIV